MTKFEQQVANSQNPNETSIKNVLYKNAMEITVNSLVKSMNEINRKAMIANANLALNNLSKFSDIATTKFDFDSYQSEKNKLKKETYAFPAVLNLGLLKSISTIPSAIMGYEFKSQIPMFVPTEKSHIGFFENIKYKDSIYDALQLAGIKLMASLPDSLVQVVIIDKSGSGQNFAKLLPLHQKILMATLTDDAEIERAIGEYQQNMRSITQSITKNEFKSVEEYNNKTDEIPQPYKFIFVANFPQGFSKRSAEGLMAILDSGANAGFHVFMTFAASPSHGQDQSIVSGLPLREFIKNMTIFEIEDSPHQYVDKKYVANNTSLFKSPLKNEKEIKTMFNAHNKIDFERIEDSVFSRVIADLSERIENVNIRPTIEILRTIPKDINEFWTKKAGDGVSVPFAKRGIEDIYFSIGVNQYGESEPVHHGLIGGVTGSGKTVTLHDIILGICIHYPPEEVKLWLLDYKEGTEFALYQNFPYIQILSMESEIEFGHQVLERAIQTIEERGALFKKVGARNLGAYNEEMRKKGEKPLPRIILIIDEFQMLFPTTKAKITEKSNDFIDNILRRGRSFGVNIILSTQTLKGVELTASIMSNLPLRIALKMDEKDAVKFFTEDNQAPKYLKYVGEGIYNNSSGLPSENVFFQGYYASEEAIQEIQDMLINKMKTEREPGFLEAELESRFVYRGDSPGDISLNKDYTRNMSFDNYEVYIGEPAGLEESHIKMAFKKDYADNCAVVGTDMVRGESMFKEMLFQLSQSKKRTKFYFANFYNALSESFDKTIEKITSKKQHDAISFNNLDADTIINEVYQDYKERVEILKDKQRAKTEKKDDLFVFLFFIENASFLQELRSTHETTKGKFMELITKGPETGIHVCLYATTYSTLTSTDINRVSQNFKKKIIFKDGDGLKFAGTDLDIEFSKSANVAIYFPGDIDAKITKFKPYINKDI